jgi:hypothetical protein
MAIVQIPGGLWLGRTPIFSAAAPSSGSPFALSASAQVQGVVLQVPKTGTLDKFEFMMSAVANNPINGIRLSFRDIAADGFPDATNDQFRDIPTGSIAAGTWMVPGLMTDDGTDTGVKRSVTKGDWLGCLVGFVSFVGGNSVTTAGIATTVGRDNNSYFVNDNVGWNKNSFATLQWQMGLKYDDGTYANISPELLPIVLLISNAFASNSTPDEYALRFQVPVECELSAVMLRMTANNFFDLVLYDAGDNVVFTVTHDPDFSIGGGNLVIVVPDTILTANSTYRLAVKPTTTSSITLYSTTVNVNANFGAFPGGIEFYRSTRTDGGAWTDSNITRPWMNLFFNGIDGGSSGGGGGSFLSIG